MLPLLWMTGIGVGLWLTLTTPVRGLLTILTTMVLGSVFVTLLTPGLRPIFLGDPLWLPVGVLFACWPWWWSTLRPRVAQQPRRALLDESARRWWPIWSMMGLAVLATASPLIFFGSPYTYPLVFVVPAILLPAFSYWLPKLSVVAGIVMTLFCLAAPVLRYGGNEWPGFLAVSLLLSVGVTLGRSRVAPLLAYLWVVILAVATIDDFLGIMISRHGAARYWPQMYAILTVFGVVLLWGSVLAHKWVLASVSVQHQARALRTQSTQVSERARLARDLHDVVAHHVSLIAVRAETAPYTHPTLDAQGRALVAEIAEDARRALDELRGVLGLLRRSEVDGGTADTAPLPGGNDLVPLVERNRAAGMAISLSDQRGAYTELVYASSRGHVIYRVLQEALTNARRHAPDQPVLVMLSDQAPQLVVTNPTVGAGVEIGAGTGIIGMRERVEALGGQLEVTDDGVEFRVEVHL